MTRAGAETAAERGTQRQRQVRCGGQLLKDRLQGGTYDNSQVAPTERGEKTTAGGERPDVWLEVMMLGDVELKLNTYREHENTTKAPVSHKTHLSTWK